MNRINYLKRYTAETLYNFIVNKWYCENKCYCQCQHSTFTFFQSVERNANEQNVINKARQRQAQYDLSNIRRRMSHKVIELLRDRGLFFHSTDLIRTLSPTGKFEFHKPLRSRRGIEAEK
jgi:hypothetical protein